MLAELQNNILNAVKTTFDIDPGDLVLVPTRKEFEGDYTIVVFPLVKQLKAKPEDIANKLGSACVENIAAIEGFNVVKGFLNLSLTSEYWKEILDRHRKHDIASFPKTGKKYVVEYASPNTNKPIHLGHLRNILLGYSVSNLLDAAGHEVHRTQIINDRGIAICKSMLAWERFANGATPDSLGVKGDQYVGDMYVRFNNAINEEYAEWQSTDAADKAFNDQDKFDNKEAFFKAYKNQYFNDYSELGQASREMLLKWEDGDPDTVKLWETMNGWVYKGFWATFDALGVHFDSNYYESQTYKLGKSIVEKGLKDGIFYQKEDGSIWADLESFGLDQKLLLRSDGTSVYITQDIGTALQRHNDINMDALVYTVGNEQDYHFKALFAVLKLLGEPYADNLYHLSYGMVELPTGKMKSREGTVVDADDLMEEVISAARENAAERGGLAMLSEEEQGEINRIIGMAALKYHMLRVDPRKKMVFDPKESVDLHGQTGPYIQNAFVRIKSIGRKFAEMNSSEGNSNAYTDLLPEEKGLIRSLIQFDDEVKMAADKYDPSTIANFAYNLAKDFHRFYHDVPILQSDAEGALTLRMNLINEVARVLEKALHLLGIEMPDRM